MRVRPATLKDAALIHGFVNALEDSNFDQEVFEKLLKENLSNKSIIYLIVQTNKAPIGFLSCHIQNLLHHNSKVAEIQEMFVVKEHRGEGVGKKLLDFLIQELRKRNVPQLEVVSNRKRKRTHQFYLDQKFSWTSKKFVRSI